MALCRDYGRPGSSDAGNRRRSFVLTMADLPTQGLHSAARVTHIRGSQGAGFALVWLKLEAGGSYLHS
jgi:hypothetical protein